jgi:iron-sulfur cluster assembly accessory protein
MDDRLEPVNAWSSLAMIHTTMETAQSSILGITEEAAVKAIALARREGREEANLRLRVLAGGCSGFSYRLSFDEGPTEGDHVVEAHGMRLLVDPKSAPIVEGSTLEFRDAMLGGGFKVNNPRAVHECACGESFSV